MEVAKEVGQAAVERIVHKSHVTPALVTRHVQANNDVLKYRTIKALWRTLTPQQQRLPACVQSKLQPQCKTVTLHPGINLL